MIDRPDYRITICVENVSEYDFWELYHILCLKIENYGGTIDYHKEQPPTAAEKRDRS